MSRKRRQPLPKGWFVDPREVSGWLDVATRQVAQHEYERVIETSRRILRHAPSGSEQHQYALRYLGTALSLLQRLDEAYEVLTEAVRMYPGEADLWHNRGLASRFTMRFGQSLRDFERASELAAGTKMAADCLKELEFSQKIAEQSIALRGPGFTLDQLIEQEELFQTGVGLMAREEWAPAEEAFRRVISIGDCLPQPWGNLGLCLMMQRRLDEAEAALRRALERDPKYEIARGNLAALAEIRRTGVLPPGTIAGPFDDTKLKSGLKLFRG